MGNEELRYLKTFDQCKEHLTDFMDKPTACREKILNICRWLYSVKNSPKWNSPITAYSAKKKEVRFFLNSKGEDHFLCIKYGKNCTEMHFFRLNINESYIQAQTDNKSWFRINGANIGILSEDKIKEYT